MRGMQRSDARWRPLSRWTLLVAGLTGLGLLRCAVDVGRPPIRCTADTERACMLPDGSPGEQRCAGPDLGWTPCLLTPTSCEPGLVSDDGAVEERWVRVCPGSVVMGSPGVECNDGCTCGQGEGQCLDLRCFDEGCPGAEPTRERDEDQRLVHITRPFEMQATELTRWQWQEMTWQGQPVLDPSWCGALQEAPKCLTVRYPADQLTWYEALAWCNWRSEQDGLEPCYALTGCAGTPGATGEPEEPGGPTGPLVCDKAVPRHDPLQACPGYRLPTEAEWEYARRAGRTGMAFATGDLSAEELSEHWVEALDPTILHGREEGNFHNEEVASRQPNPWGLYDLPGSVYEWVWDRYDGFEREEVVDPLGPSDGGYRGMRGAAYSSMARSCRAAARHDGAPGLVHSVGFRPVRTVE